MKTYLKTIEKKDYYLFEDDPVRPHLDSNFRTSEECETFVLTDNEKPLAVVCVAYTYEVATTEQELKSLSGNTVAMFYTVWSYSKGAGREIIQQVVQEIMLNKPSVKRFVTLSPKTDVAKKFHLKNGAISLQENEYTINYEYTLPTTVIVANAGLGKNFLAFMANPNAVDSFENNGEYFYENKHWENYRQCYAEHPEYLLRLHWKHSPDIKTNMYKLQLKRMQKHRLVVIHDGPYTFWGSFLMQFKHYMNQEHYESWNIKTPEWDALEKKLAKTHRKNPKTLKHMDWLYYQLDKHDIEHIVLDYHSLFVEPCSEAWKQFQEFTGSSRSVDELMTYAYDYHQMNLELVKEKFNKTVDLPVV